MTDECRFVEGELRDDWCDTHNRSSYTCDERKRILKILKNELDVTNLDKEFYLELKQKIEANEE